MLLFFFSSRRRHTRCALVTGVQTCALPILPGMSSLLAAAVGEVLHGEVVSSATVHGGDVAAAFRMDLADGRRVFAKTHPHPPAGFFSTEAAGLRWQIGRAHV